ncbi:hypothetical protein HHK36_016346 [Tetracentron sinense]|uniref:LOB domain-containing protein n=1 Tax=Tetracentron sinense TaxID=13715 RepID=A0A834YZH4_TETSI|nr:hypothetical protein HHK36_016346 [Tetracentron sinense]
MTGLGSSCGACKFLRRKCTSGCVFAPYFFYDQAATHFAAVHKVFGASNVSKLLSHLPLQNRSEAAITISYEALARIRDPKYGCVAHIYALQQQVANLQEEIEFLRTQMENRATDISSRWSSQETNNPNNGFQLSSQLDARNIQDYLNQQAPLPFSTVNETCDQALDNEMNLQLSSLCSLGDETLLCDSEPNHLERLLEGMDQEIFSLDPWLCNRSWTGY